MKQSVNLCDRNHFLLLKAIAILSVIIGHIGNFTGKTWFTPLGGFGVAIFLFCSGYGLTISAKNGGGVKNYWFKKIINVYLPFFIIECITSFIFKRSFLAFILDITFIKMSHPYGWYMQYLFVCYLIFYLIFVLIKNEKFQNIVFIILGLVSFFIFPNLQAEQALSFVLGIIAARYIDANTINKNKLILIGSCLIVLGIIFLAIKQIPYCRMANHYVITFLNLSLKLSLAMGVILISFIIGKYIKFLLPIGKISYELYLVHGYFIFVISKNLFKNFVLNSTVFIIFVFLVSAIFYIMNLQISKIFRRMMNSEPQKNIDNKQ